MKIGDYDFSGWASRNNLKCSDNRIIRKDAFKVNDGKKVPLVWNHQYGAVSNVLGHAILENRDEGVYAYCKLNNTKAGQEAKEVVKHGDVDALSIWANNLEQVGLEVVHGVIREVSLVLAGANPGAFIESVLSHGDTASEYDDEAIFHNGYGIEIFHAESEKDKKEEEDEKTKKEADDETLKDVYDTLTEKQKKAVAIIVGQVAADSKSEKKDEEEEKEMRQSIFEGDPVNSTQTLTHSDIKEIFDNAKKCGSLKMAVQDKLGDDASLIHSIDKTGMETAKGVQTYGFNDVEMLYPDYKSLSVQPEWLSRNMTWVQNVMANVHRTPFSRIKSVFADITEDEARARGYIKGKQKKEEVFTTLKRTTEPQTIYKKQKLDKDDILDITDFDIVAWIKSEMQIMLDEEVARAILIGDGRPSDSDDKIKEDRIRPVVSDVPLFNTVVKVTVPSGSDEATIADATIDAIIRSRKHYKGTGNPTFYTTEDPITEMLLLRDKIGNRQYKTTEELSTALRVKEIMTVEPMEGHEVTLEGKKYPLIGTMVNLADYNVGKNKNADSDLLSDFDIDFNQYKYLLETRMSGALVRPFSAVTFVLDDGTNGISLLSGSAKKVATKE